MSSHPILRLLDSVTWTPVAAPIPADRADATLPYPTHEGTLSFAGAAFRAYRLSDGRRILDAEDLERFLAARDAPAPGGPP